MAPERIYFFDDEIGTQVFNPANDSWTIGASLQTSRSFVGVAVIDVLFYVMGGDIMPPTNILIANITAIAGNEQYTPIGYGTVTQQPPPESFPFVLVAAASGVSVAIIGVGLLVYFKRRPKGVVCRL